MIEKLDKKWAGNEELTKKVNELVEENNRLEMKVSNLKHFIRHGKEINNAKRHQNKEKRD